VTKNALPKILVIDDETSITGALELILADQGYAVTACQSGKSARSEFNAREFDLVFTDLRLPDASGIDLVSEIKAANARTEVILMTAHGSLDVTIEAIKRGAFYYLEKPFTPDQVTVLAQRALELGRVKQENLQLKNKLTRDVDSFGMIGRSAKMQQIYETIQATAASDASVLLEGESGTGKELIAAAFHSESDRADRPFIRINCAAIPHDLIESELFGYKKGAFTGADRDKRGLIEATAGGTLLLDEIGEMPVSLQSKLLRVLQDRTLRRVGDEQEIKVDFRLVSATNRDTLQASKTGAFREDLYFRISTIKLKVPPLRERHDDLALLTESFLHRFAEKYRKPIKGLAPATFTRLSRYDWPGNVRELESVIERAVLFCQGDHLQPDHLPEQFQTSDANSTCVIPPFMTMDEIEREALAQTLERTGGNVKRTAEILDLHRPTLYRRLRKFGLRSDDLPPETELEDGDSSVANAG
jgi:DNA-binding NtrC family response regulator